MANINKIILRHFTELHICYTDMKECIHNTDTKYQMSGDSIGY